MTKVKLRQKKLQSGKLSLYLDFYPPIVNPETGKSTRREFLKIHLEGKPKGKNERDNNNQKKRIAGARPAAAPRAHRRRGGNQETRELENAFSKINRYHSRAKYSNLPFCANFTECF